MGHVLWANIANQAKLCGAESDLKALYDLRSRLDKIMLEIRCRPLAEMIDITDLSVNMDVLELPEGMESTTELMMAEGVWIDADVARRDLEKLRDHLNETRPKLGLLKDKRPQVIEELDEVLEFISKNAEPGARFNFCEVM